MTDSGITSIEPSFATSLESEGISSWLTTLFGIASGLLAANVYYSQPISEAIATSIGFPPSATGLIVAFTQAGFGIGLFLIVPLGDLIENRRLVLTLTILAGLALLAGARSATPAAYLGSALLVGLGSVAVQVIIPFAAHMAPEHARGRVVGNVMSGLMIGILLARPMSSFVTHAMSWHAVFYMSGGGMFALALALALALPKREPAAMISYLMLLKSMGHLALATPVLQRRAFYQACLFGTFSLFWTTVPLLLTKSFHMSQSGVALFALAGGAGAIAAPLAGRAADRGWTTPGTAVAILSVAVAILVTRFATAESALGIPLLVGAAILLDFGMTANLTFGQRSIFVLGAEYRSRLNGLYMSAFFGGGAVGSTLGGFAYTFGGWSLASWIGFALPMLAIALFVIHRVRARADTNAGSATTK